MNWVRLGSDAGLQSRLDNGTIWFWESWKNCSHWSTVVDRYLDSSRELQITCCGICPKSFLHPFFLRVHAVSSVRNFCCPGYADRSAPWPQHLKIDGLPEPGSLTLVRPPLNVSCTFSVADTQITMMNFETSVSVINFHTLRPQKSGQNSDQKFLCFGSFYAGSVTLNVTQCYSKMFKNSQWIQMKEISSCNIILFHVVIICSVWFSVASITFEVN
jgi:hypothetical protein